jgi:hypothetical protein
VVVAVVSSVVVVVAVVVQHQKISIARLVQGSAAWQNGKQSRMGGGACILDRSSRNRAAGSECSAAQRDRRAWQCSEERASSSRRRVSGRAGQGGEERLRKRAKWEVAERREAYKESRSDMA